MFFLKNMLKSKACKVVGCAALIGVAVVTGELTLKDGTDVFFKTAVETAIGE